MCKLDLEKAEEQSNQIANIHWIIEREREFKKKIYFCFIKYTKDFDCVNHSKLWKILQEMGIPDRLTCLLKNLCRYQEAAVRTRHGTTDWFQIGEGVRQGCILSPSLFNLYAEYIMRNARCLVCNKHDWLKERPPPPPRYVSFKDFAIVSFGK